MKIDQVKEIANAVLYEGYLLYPYRRSAIKNRQRWTFGVVYPREYSEANGGVEPWTMRTECLITGQADTMVDVTVRFLHLLIRRVPDRQHADAGAADAQLFRAAIIAAEPWEEGMEREVYVPALSLGALVAHSQRVEIAFAGGTLYSPAPASARALAEQDERAQWPVAGAIVVAAEPVPAEHTPGGDGIRTNLFKLIVQIENTTPGTGAVTGQHEAILRQSFVATHTILQVSGGAFISLLDPPEYARTAAQGCQNLRTWPVLVGDEGECTMMLSSPIILYDYPQIAPESAGPLFDGTEIDELLTLRIMTLTDEEKEEIRQGDERAREILERTEALTPEQLMKLHGAIRSLRPVDEGEEP
jgi:hypothetical protein